MIINSNKNKMKIQHIYGISVKYFLYHSRHQIHQHESKPSKNSPKAGQMLSKVYQQAKIKPYLCCQNVHQKLSRRESNGFVLLVCFGNLFKNAIFSLREKISKLSFIHAMCLFGQGISLIFFVFFLQFEVVEGDTSHDNLFFKAFINNLIFSIDDAMFAEYLSVLSTREVELEMLVHGRVIRDFGFTFDSKFFKLFSIEHSLDFVQLIIINTSSLLKNEGRDTRQSRTEGIRRHKKIRRYKISFRSERGLSFHQIRTLNHFLRLWGDRTHHHPQRQIYQHTQRLCIHRVYWFGGC